MISNVLNKYPEEGTAGLHHSSTCNSLKYLCTVFYGGYTILHSHSRAQDIFKDCVGKTLTHFICLEKKTGCHFRPNKITGPLYSSLQPSHLSRQHHFWSILKHSALVFVVVSLLVDCRTVFSIILN